MLGLGSLVAIPSVKAESNLTSIQVGITNASTQISQFQDELARLSEQVSRTDQAINDNNKMIADTEEKMKASETEIQQVQGEIATLKDKIEKRNEILKKRAQSFQESGVNVSYLDVILGASSFNDFVDKINAVATVISADSDIMKQAEADKLEMENKQASVEQKLSDLKNSKMELDDMQAQILEQKTQNDALKAELQKKQQDSITEKASLQQEASKIAAQNINVSPVTQGSSKVVNTQSSTSANIAAINVSTPKSNGSINDIISAGYKYIGHSSYKFSGGRTASDIAQGLFDCSGFVHWAFAQGGYSIGASTDSLKNSGTRVSLSQARPGDLVFFNTVKTDGHVGIYLGGGKFIGSQSSTGVAIADLTTGYWKDTFNGRVVRILN